MATMKDVARQAGVSTSTVSHVINKDRFVSEAITAKVEAAIKELNYAPSALADAPRDKCTLSCAINGIHAAFHYLKKNYISGCVMTVPTG